MVLQWTIAVATIVETASVNIVHVLGSLRALTPAKILRTIGRNSGKEKNVVKAKR